MHIILNDLMAIITLLLGKSLGH